MCRERGIQGGTGIHRLFGYAKKPVIGGQKMQQDRYQLADRRRARNQKLATAGVILLALGVAAAVAYALLYV
ncbi:hypothetical protein GCM10023081_08320 [Arthrobacter ginkgonis]|uniref:Uncharacterized protein n=1 Tax=Arthrobacter ginkgonis TaxID=1630594 RepID=A0ABP7BZ03_9MICC